MFDIRPDGDGWLYCALWSSPSGWDGAYTY